MSISARFNVDSGRGIYESPSGGIVLEASRLDLGDSVVALALVADLSGVDGGRNWGQSLTNCLDTVIQTYRDTIMETLGAEDVLWIELDSLGGFDQVIPDFSGARPSLHWQPIVSGLDSGRTEKDFIFFFGNAARRAVANVHRAVGFKVNPHQSY